LQDEVRSDDSQRAVVAGEPHVIWSTRLRGGDAYVRIALVYDDVLNLMTLEDEAFPAAEPHVAPDREELTHDGEVGGVRGEDDPDCPVHGQRLSDGDRDGVMRDVQVLRVLLKTVPGIRPRPQGACNLDGLAVGGEFASHAYERDVYILSHLYTRP